MNNTSTLGLGELINRKTRNADERSLWCSTVSGLWSQESFQGEGMRKALQEEEILRGLALKRKT